jgi:hypothetical protein
MMLSRVESSDVNTDESPVAPEELWTDSTLCEMMTSIPRIAILDLYDNVDGRNRSRLYTHITMKKMILMTATRHV